MKKLSSLFLPAVLILIMTLHGLSLCVGTARGQSLRSDGHGYYAWLPALLIHRDPSFHTLVEHHYAGNPNVAGLTLVPSTNRYASKYGVGVALMELPGFVLAHTATRFMRNPQSVGWEPYQFSADGYSLFYQCSVAASGMTAAMLGLFLLRSLLRRFYGEPVVLLSLTALILGTSWLHYASMEVSMSHVFSFFLFTAFLSLALRWAETRQWGDALLLGLVSGLIALVRLPNLLIWLSLPFLLPGGLRQMVRVYGRQGLGMAALTFILFLPQLFLWRYAAGHWTFSGYAAHNEGFFWFHPQIFPVWFGIKKGLVFYAPVLLLAFAGFFLRAPLRCAALAVFLPVTYLISCWHMWWFGGSFGHRAFIEYFAFLAFPLAAVLQKLWTRSPRITGLLLILCCGWTLWWMKMYNTREYSIEGLDAQALYDIFYIRWHALRALFGR